MIELPVMASPVDQLWHVLLDLSESLTVPWTLVGGQMVLLHAIEHGQVPPEPSQDGDVVADLRADHGALAQVVRQLETLGCLVPGPGRSPKPRTDHPRSPHRWMTQSRAFSCAKSRSTHSPAPERINIQIK